MSQSVGMSQSLAKHRGQRNPSLLSWEWQTHNVRGPESGKRVGKPIIMRSPAAVEPDPLPPDAVL